MIFQLKHYMHFLSIVCTAQFIFLGLINRISRSTNYVFPSFQDPYTLFGILFSNTLNLPYGWDNKFNADTKQEMKV